MKWSLKIARVAGIDVFLHWTFIVLLVGVLVAGVRTLGQEGGSLNGFWFILLLFLFVLLHEFGHALMGKRFGVKTNHITLLPIGGVAAMEHIPEKPWQEMLIALAGPAVNFVLAIGFLIFLALSGHVPAFSDWWSPVSNDNMVYSLFTTNVMLFSFNLIPAFPMDGGRVLRALLAMKYGRYKATNIAVRIGQLLAIGLILFGLSGNIWLVFIGVFIYLGAGAEGNYESTRSALSKYKVQDAIMHHFTPLQSTDTIGMAVRLLLDGQEKEFVVLENQTVVGTLTRNEMIEGLGHFGKEAALSEVMKKVILNLEPQMPLDDVYDQMTDENVEIAPVFENNKLIGVLNRDNIMELLIIDNAQPHLRLS
ncbi:MAG TPA: site-2 protease family protein [Haliscomenobacter sp.]|uniref:site-2 protease family protein n=1 Tax=Haliscomenobacter sp. TaxID=2717303 RepID=UPI002D020BE1|nr:site-2 protease family protein [Haliscomenobacter sp.]HOY19356.1 site-2 protease family protein [Haliscomenobacter sp.]HPH21257.1 site-2 protease family protein [Haliscomenobacter sp.]